VEHGPWALQDVKTPSQGRFENLPAYVRSASSQVDTGLSPVLLGAQGLPRKEDGDRGREDCHTVPDLSPS